MFVPSIDRIMPLRRVCCCARSGWQEISIDRGRAPQQHGTQQHGVEQQMRVVWRCQLTSKL